MKSTIRKIFLSNARLLKLYIHLSKSKEKRKYKRFCKFCSKQIDFFENKNNTSCCASIPNNAPVWFYWNSGIDNLPPIAKICYKRNLELHKSRLIIIDQSNLNQYCDFPAWLLKKYNDKIISQAHFADLIRLKLLIEYGGVWADSTVYFSKEIPDQIAQSDLFVFKSNKDLKEMANISNWFIVSKPNNIILKEVYYLLEKWWFKNNHVPGYLFFHWAFSFCSKRHLAEWYKIEFISNEIPHIIQRNLFYKKYDKVLFEKSLEKCFCHKFTLHYEKPQAESTLYKILNCDKIFS